MTKLLAVLVLTLSLCSPRAHAVVYAADPGGGGGGLAAAGAWQLSDESPVQYGDVSATFPTTAAFTFCADVYFDDANAYDFRPVFSSQSSSEEDLFYPYGQSTQELFWYSDGSGSSETRADYTPSDDTWYSVCVAVNTGNVCALYLNGVSQTLDVAGCNLSDGTLSDTYIGYGSSFSETLGSSVSGGTAWLSNIRMHSAYRDSTWIGAHWNCALQSDTSNLWAQWRFTSAGDLTSQGTSGASIAWQNSPSYTNPPGGAPPSNEYDGVSSGRTGSDCYGAP